jgi:electron transfer flavoprotein alpha subunit
MKRSRGGEIVVITEISDGRPAPVTAELVAFATALGRKIACRVRVVIPGGVATEAAATIAATPGIAATAIAGKNLAAYNAEAWTATLAPILAHLQPRFICISHTANGADFAPGLAIRLGAACITAVEAFEIDAEGPVFRRSIHRGKLQMDIVPEAEITVLTLLPGAFDRGAMIAPADGPPDDALAVARKSAPAEAAGEVITAPDIPLKTRIMGLMPAPSDTAELAAAEVVIAAGRGIGNAENIALLRALASLFSRSALGASRAVCDAGWLPYRCQVGQTGQTVSPRLYMACGISGAVQHLAGMRGAACVVAVNRDPQAAIFRVADVAIVEELVSFLPLLIDACRQRRQCFPEATP